MPVPVITVLFTFGREIHVYLETSGITGRESEKIGVAFQIAGGAEGALDLAADVRQVSAAGRRGDQIESSGIYRERGLGPRDPGVNPANIIWIFCVARSGSTWLSGTMGELKSHKAWKEPSVGHLFGEFFPPEAG